ncbi:MAG: ribosomal-protein-serine acetyltransferase [Saprospiraceae bacterium]|jgi:ribosomal-protein-serine acetyltransferase
MQFEDYSIRLLTPEDLEVYFQMVEKNRSRLEDFFTGTVSRTKTLEDTRIFISEMVQHAIDKTYFAYLIIDNTDNSIIGFMDLKNIDWNISKAEMGGYIDKDYASKGITTKAFRLFCDICFQEHEFKKLFLRTHPTNLAARKIAEKCGFEVEGIIKRDYKTTSGEIIDLVYYGRLN